MNIDKDIIKENAMSRKLRITEKTGGGDTKDTDSAVKSKSKKRSEPSLDKLNQKDTKITLPLSQIDDHIFSNISRLSKDDFKIPKRKKNTDNTRTFSHCS